MFALCMVACVTLTPLGSAMAVHHMDDVDSMVVLTDATIDATAKAPFDHAPLPAGDHDCHGCSAAVLDAPAAAHSARMATVVTALSDALVVGRGPETEFRPPRS